MSKPKWGDRIDWNVLGRRSRERLAQLKRNGSRSRDWDLDFYAAVLHMNIRLFQPFIVMGRIINYLVALVFLAGAAWAAWMLLEHQATPVDFLETRVLTPVVAPGGKIQVLFDINRRKVCQVDPDWSVFGGDGRKYSFVAQRLEVGGPLGHDPFIRAFELPRDIAPGQGRFRVGWSWVCPLNFIDLQFPRASDVKDISFTIASP